MKAKNIISLILSMSLLIGTMSIGSTAYAEVLEERAIDNFVESTCDVIREYDSDKEFVVEETEELQSEADNVLDDIDFQTCRLIVKANGAFDDLNAKEHIRGFKDIHILQYADEKSAETAYQSLENDKDVIYVSADNVKSDFENRMPLADGTEEDTSTDTPPESYNGHLCDWASELTQTAQVNDYIEKANIPVDNMVVGIIDGGIDYNHEFLQRRVKRTYFNISSDGNENDELDVVDGHGTAVGSVIVDNTPDEVRIASYRIFNSQGICTATGIYTAIIQSVNDNVDIINMSIGGLEEKGDEILYDAAAYARENNVTMICAAGNEATNIDTLHYLPANFEETIAIASSDNAGRYSEWTNYGANVDFSAPGEDVNVAVPGNKYDVFTGTSFSSPFAVATYLLVKIFHPDWNEKRIVDNIKKNSDVAKVRAYESKEIIEYGDKYYGNGSGIVNLGFLLNDDKSISAPTFDKKGGNYDNSVTLTITPKNKKDKIYYTTDNSYPTTQSTLYTKPIVITEDTNIRAISYSEKKGYSKPTEEMYRIFTVGTDDMFEIDETGCITAYTGHVENLRIPENINGIKVQTFVEQIFNDDYIKSIVLSEGMETIPKNGFRSNLSLQYINTAKVKTIYGSAFYGNPSLRIADLPEVEFLDEMVFAKIHENQNKFYLSINAPKVIEMGAHCIEFTGLSNLYAPNLETMGDRIINYCNSLLLVDLPSLKSGKSCFVNACNIVMNISAPKLSNLRIFAYKDPISEKHLDKLRTFNFPLLTICPATAKNIGYGNQNFIIDSVLTIPNNNFNAFTFDKKRIFARDLQTIESTDCFGEYPVERLDMSNIVTAAALPQNQGCTMTLPSTFESCTEDTNGRNYTIYGTPGTYAESWAKENNHTFIEVSQENSIITDIDEEYYGWGDLTFDVYGFNKQFAWYGCDENGENPVKLCTTERGEFSPLNYDNYPSYYCVCTSTDGDSVVEISSRICKNVDYAIQKYKVDEMGGSIRVTDAGLRFGFFYDESQTEKVDEYGFVYTNNSDYTNALRVNNVDSKNIYQLKANNRITHEDNKTTFNLVFTKIPSSAYDMEISARAYVKIDDTYFYSDVLQRSYNQVANKVLADDAVDESIKQSVRKILNKEV